MAGAGDVFLFFLHNDDDDGVGRTGLEISYLSLLPSLNFHLMLLKVIIDKY